MVDNKIAKELHKIRKEVEALSSKKEMLPVSNEAETSIATMMKYMMDERDKTNRAFSSIMEKIRKMEEQIDGMYVEGEEKERNSEQRGVSNREIPVSDIDVKLINLAQSRNMICADDVKTLMGYRGRNAACARLNKLYREGLLDRFQLGHKVYYKYDAGKTTNTLIISPPQ